MLCGCVMKHTKNQLLVAIVMLPLFSTDPVERKPGDQWLIKGPIEYVPPVEVVVKDKR